MIPPSIDCNHTLMRVIEPGTFGPQTIEEAIACAQLHAVRHGSTVLLWFNDVILPIEPNTPAEESLARYNAQCCWRFSPRLPEPYRV